jgi:hypothetical protein
LGLRHSPLVSAVETGDFDEDDQKDLEIVNKLPPLFCSDSQTILSSSFPPNSQSPDSPQYPTPLSTFSSLSSETLPSLHLSSLEFSKFGNNKKKEKEEGKKILKSRNELANEKLPSLT